MTLSDEFHYVRTSGADGGVDAIEGAAIGLDLESVFKDGLPPFNIALEIIAACCEILDISDEDGEIHGNIEPKYVFIDDTGAVSIESFGADRSETRAPESEVENTLTDLYGLGYLAFCLFSPNPPKDIPTTDPDEHDDAVIDAVLTINFEGLPEEMTGDVQWFIAKLMSFEPEDRPPAVDAWRTFIAFADACDGPDFVDWCAASLDGEGERRDSDAVARSMVPPDEDPVSEEEEDLGGPVMAAGPLKKGMQLGGGGAAKGQATAFWSKDAMKAALAAEEEDEQSEEAFRPSVGGGAATSFWSKEQMQAMASGNSQAPRPKRGGGNARGGNVRSTTFAPASSIPSRDTQENAAEQDEIPTEASPSPIAGPIASGPTAPSKPATKPAASPAPATANAEPAKSKMPLIAGVVVVLLLLVCMGALAIGGGAYVLSGDDSATSTSTKSTETKEKEKPAPVRDTGQAEPSNTPAPKPIAPIKPSATPKPKSTSKPKPKPKPKPTNGPARVNFKGLGRGKLTCSGVKKDFDGSIAMTFQQYELPVSCVVEIEGKNGSFWVKGSGDISCRPQGGAVTCDKAEVP